MRFDAFLDNFAIKNFTHPHNSPRNNYIYNIRLNGSTFISYDDLMFIGIGTNILRILYSIKKKFNIKHNDNKIKISQHLNEMSSRNIMIEISIIDDDKTTNLRSSVTKSLPLGMLSLIFGTKIITFYGEDVTDLFESNFNSVKRYHDFMAVSNIESKRISDMCNIDVVREMFK